MQAIADYAMIREGMEIMLETRPDPDAHFQYPAYISTTMGDIWEIN